VEESAQEQIRRNIMVRSGNEDLRKEVGTLEEESILSERLAFTGRIAASIAHEIRNPLGNLSMAVQLLREAFTEDSPWAKHIDVIIRNANRINFLITELLNCARPPKLSIRPHDIHEVLANVLDTLKDKVASHGIELNKEFNSQSPLIKVDREQINRVFSNVIINSIEAMPKGGKIIVITEDEAMSLAVKIQDSGEGIPEEDIIRIFDPFFSTKPSGIGLGLSITYGIVVSHGGTIGVESRPKRGTVFTISLPKR
jgi:signal transduction histidine kinase